MNLDREDHKPRRKVCIKSELSKYFIWFSIDQPIYILENLIWQRNQDEQYFNLGLKNQST